MRNLRGVILHSIWAEVLLCIEEAMGPAASCLLEDTCCRSCPVLYVVTASVTVVVGFLVAVKANVMKVVVLTVLVPTGEGLL
jgi:hypothetical protein